MESRKHSLQARSNGYPGTGVARIRGRRNSGRLPPGNARKGRSERRGSTIPFPARNESGRYRSPLDILKYQMKIRMSRGG